MKKNFFRTTMIAALICSGANVLAANKVYDEASLQEAIFNANNDSSIERIVFADEAMIFLTAPVIYTGSQALTLVGHNSTIDGSAAGSFILDGDLTAVTEDGTLIFNTASDLAIRKLTVVNSATRGIVVNIPVDAENHDVDISLHQVNIIDSALYGLHIDDNADAFDEGDLGSNVGIDLHISRSNFIGNGTGAIDFDGIRVDERSRGNINVMIWNTHIDGNGGDGLELDEAGVGNIEVTMSRVTFNNNGLYNEADLDDGFDIDEADDGNVEVKLYAVEVNNNGDEGLDFDEKGNGNLELKLGMVNIMNNIDEGIKLNEEDAGDLEASLRNVKVMDSDNDGIQLTEEGDGRLELYLKTVTASNNKNYGIKAEQWFIKDEDVPVEAAGQITADNVVLQGNGKGDDINVNNIIIE